MLRVAVLLAIATAGFAATYSVAPTPVPSGLGISGMSGINNAGQVAGTGTNETTNLAFIGTTLSSTVNPLPSGWTSSSGAGINASGQVVGTVYNCFSRLYWHRLGQRRDPAAAPALSSRRV